jgi:hypothetical protein
MAFTVTPSGISRTRGQGAPSALLIGRTDFFEQLETDIDDVFFNQTEFGETVNYYHDALSTWQIYKTLFDNPHVSMQFGADAEFNTNRPQVQLQESKFIHPLEKNDEVIVRGVRYFVDDVVSDGVGVSTVYMHRKK